MNYLETLTLAINLTARKTPTATTEYYKRKVLQTLARSQKLMKAPFSMVLW
jgi:hypothetical protein